MPRKAYLADLGELTNAATIHGISHVQAGALTGDFTFRVTTTAAGSGFQVSASVFPDLSEYPSGHTFTFGDETPSEVTAKLSARSTGKTLGQLLALASRAFVAWDEDGDTIMPDSHVEQEEEDDSDGTDHDEDFDFDGCLPQRHDSKADPLQTSASNLTSGARDRIRSDLRAAKDAGFKVGYHGRIVDGSVCYVSVSCRISKLGISEEAMQAWQVNAPEYLILLMHFPQGYKPLDSLVANRTVINRDNVQFRVGASHTYKPTFLESRRAFTVLGKEDEADEAACKTSAGGRGFRPVFVSRPLNDLLNERLLALVGFRLGDNMSWAGAEEYYIDVQGKSDVSTSPSPVGNNYSKKERTNSAYPRLVTSDQISSARSAQPVSLPLVAMQFVLRHFVRCTEFCLVCHRKLDIDLEAIKPYVCDQPLCLYQYMSLGFGPSIEHEIVAQPYVVDLLISFCYTSAKTGHLKDFPQGLSLLVPSPLAWTGSRQTDAVPHVDVTACSESVTEYDAKFDRVTLELLFERGSTLAVREGDWIVIRYPRNSKDSKMLHCRITQTTYFPTVRVSEPIELGFLDTNVDIFTATPRNGTVNPVNVPAATLGRTDVSFSIYNTNFDGLQESSKRDTIVKLLHMLPSVKEMRDYLSRKTTPTLAAWSDRIPPANLSLLRWIIASSRACIMQVDDEEASPNSSSVEMKSREQGVYGMNGWMQFRFAMGAPDKERRFVNAVRDTVARLKLTYPTIFAWHGSPLFNWHSIIREGLHFKKIAYGRAFGNGCYHSLDYNTSLGYSGTYHYGGASGSTWPQSRLQISSALALNEIVNAPQEFVSMNPHLVVAQLDWIQTRYLFVQCTGDFKPGVSGAPPIAVHEQDPQSTPVGPSKRPIVIPLTAVARSRQRSPCAVKTGHKKRKAEGSILNLIAIDDDDDTASIATDKEDLTIFIPEEVITAPDHRKGRTTSNKTQHRTEAPAKPMTDFVHGTLDQSTLPVLTPPSWATPAASKRLQADFKAIIKIQQNQPLHELGWYINPESFDNVYQWIVELHSFEPHLPLTKDMKEKGVKSIVLEMRFGKDYPMSPPFVRIIRPRFLSFQAGGGGHVTAGGALCMELLTNNGWSAVSSIESVLLQIRLAISSTDPKPARLEKGVVRDYGVGEAVDAYIRACNAHGWTIPLGFREMAYGGGTTGQGFSH